LFKNYGRLDVFVRETFGATSVAEPHHFDPALGENFDAAPAPTLLYSKAKF
jgi:hypothetical protein